MMKLVKLVNKNVIFNFRKKLGDTQKKFDYLIDNLIAYPTEGGLTLGQNKDAKPGSRCYSAVRWAMHDGNWQ